MGFCRPAEAGRFLELAPATEQAKRARLNIISHLLSQVPCKPLQRQDITLPERQPPRGYVQPDLPPRHIPAAF